MIVDAEDMDRKRAPALVELQQRAAGSGPAAVTARLGLATAGIDAWMVEEIGRGTPASEIAVAMMTRAAALVGGQLASFQPATDQRVQTVRRALLDQFEAVLSAVLDRFDTMSPAERDANSMTIHTAQ